MASDASTSSEEPALVGGDGICSGDGAADAVLALEACAIILLLEACAAAFRKLPTPKLTRSLHEAVERQQPPRRGPVRPKLRYAHQGGQNPPIVIVHGSSLDHVPETYRRYLETWLREQFSLAGTPLRIEFRSGANPYAAR